MPTIDRERWLLLEPLVNHALELDRDARVEWLERLRTESADLAEDVSRLVSGASSTDAHDFLAAPLRLATPGGMSGTEIGGYQLDRLLGSGGMGSVWLARRIDGRFDGTVAIKLLNLSLVTPVGQGRFRREGTVLARLTHPGIARLLDAGVTDAGQPYLVLEHVDGVRMDEWASDHRLTQREIIALVLQLLDAVAHAHANLVVHRDIKPSNVLVSRDGTLKLLDFGIAKLLDDSGDRTALTADGGRLLTPDYAAPEQARGDAVTTATDVYAAAVLLYVLLAGRHPTAPAEATPAGVMSALFEVTPPRLGVGDLDTILQKALRKEPRDRYQTAAALADDLHRYLRFEPVSARPDALGYRLSRFVRRNRAAVGAGAVVVASLAGATVFSAAQLRETTRQRDAAVEARTSADMQVEFQNLLLTEVGEGSITLRGLLEKGRAVLERQYGGDPRIRASLLAQLATSYSQLGDERTRATLLARAESLAVLGRAPAVHAAVRCQMADALRIDSKADAARIMIDSAEAELRRTPDDRAELTCLTASVVLENEAGTAPTEIAAARRAIALVERNGWTRSSAYADLLSSLASAIVSDNHARDALPVFRKALAITDSTGWASTMAGAVLHHDYGLALNRAGFTGEAERELHTSIIGVQRADSASPLPVQPLVHYAHLAFVQNDLDSARKYFALLEQRAIADSSAYWQARATFGLARTQLQQGDLRGAEQSRARYLIARPKVQKLSTDDQLVSAEVLTAQFALASGHADSALALLRGALEKNGYPGKPRRQHHMALILAADAALRAGKPQDALIFTAAAVRTASLDSATARDSYWVGDALLTQSRAQLAAGDTAAARLSAQHATTALHTGGGATHPRTREADAWLAALR